MIAEVEKLVRLRQRAWIKLALLQASGQSFYAVGQSVLSRRTHNQMRRFARTDERLQDWNRDNQVSKSIRNRCYVVCHLNSSLYSRRYDNKLWCELANYFSGFLANSISALQ